MSQVVKLSSIGANNKSARIATKQRMTVSDGDKEIKRIHAVINTEVMKLIDEQQILKKDVASAEQKAVVALAERRTVVAATQPIVGKAQKKGEDLCKPGEIVGQRFRILVKLCEGGYGQIYKGHDERTQNNIAIKLERLTSTNDSMESHVLKKFQGKSYHCPKIYAAGKTLTYTFVAMQLLGKNLSELRRMCPLKPPRLSFSASIRATFQCLEAVESLHNMGYIHRDVKPSNFAIGGEPKNRNVIYMLDYGLCRCFANKDGSVKQAREKIGFRGTVRYASLTAHQARDLSRRDDLISLCYLFVELTLGQLPWRRTNDRDIVAQMKTQHTLAALAVSMPGAAKSFVQRVENLQFDSKPDYGHLGQCLRQLLCEINAKMDAPYDWQLKDCKVLFHWRL